MVISPSDIGYVFSGGTNNSDPLKSLGGEPSVNIVLGLNNNLFEDVSAELAQTGNTDYRCIYVVNNNESSSLNNTKIFIEYQAEIGTNIEIGIPLEQDKQRIIIAGIAEGGSFTIKYEDSPITITWQDNLINLTSILATALNNVVPLGGIGVQSNWYANNGSTRDITRVFDIYFADDNNFRYHPLITLTSNNITGSPEIQILKLQNGCPINAIAATIEKSTTPPYGVTWSVPYWFSPVEIGILQPGDFFPVWIKRIMSPKSEPVAYDGFVLRTQGEQ